MEAPAMSRSRKKAAFPAECHSPKNELAARIEELRRKVRAMPRGSKVGVFLDRECTEFARLLREDLSKEREKAASSEADFSPSGVCALRERKAIEPGSEETQGSDDSR
jgi:hypothetical protein